MISLALLDSDANPNGSSSSAVQNLSLRPIETSRVVMVAMRAKSRTVRRLAKVPVMFEEMWANLDFIVLKNVSFDVFIGRPSIKRFWSVLNFPAEVVRFKYREETTFLTMIPEYIRFKNVTGTTDKGGFTAESEEKSRKFNADPSEGEQ